ncbi:MAG: hypothetical protein WCL19_11645 [Verrucomicrobiota bacterium]
MKKFPLLIGLLVVTLSPIPSASAQIKIKPAASTDAAYDQALLSAVGSLADAYLLETPQTLVTLARTTDHHPG